MKRFLVTLAVLLSLISGCVLPPRSVKEKSTAPVVASTETRNDLLLLDSTIMKKTMKNGLTYYIRTNAKPEKRAELRLVVNAGSVLEDDDQQGLAHFVEHMSFNGSKHFQKNELISYLESIGMRFGPNLNAYTSFDETVYMLQVPTDNDTTLEKAFQILQDWAQYLSFDDTEIDKERGVIHEEWRLDRGADARMRDKQFPVLFTNSRYANRLPIGRVAIIDSFKYETLRKFYRNWYRPNLMAVVAVGDFEKDKIETLIQKYFSPLANPKSAPKRENFPVPDTPGTLFSIETDPEATSTSIEMYYKLKKTEQGTERDFRQSLVEALFNSLFNKRLDELTRKAEPPFLQGYSAKGRFIRTRDFYVLGAMVEENGVEKGMTALLTEAKRIRQFGFTKSELERNKTEMQRGIEQAFREKDKTKSANLVSEYVRNFLVDEPVPGIEKERELYQKFLPTIQLQEVNKLGAEWMTESNCVILISAPDKKGVKVPTENQLIILKDSVEKSPLTAYDDKVTDDPLLATPPIKGKIVAETKNEKLGTTVLRLSNNIQVVLKPTTFRNDEILVAAISPGGNSLVPDSDFVSALTAIPVIRQSGLAKFSKVDLNKKLAGKVVTVNPSIGETYESISASASPEDVETMFQILYLFFTDVRQDSSAYLAYRAMLKTNLESRNLDPGMAFRDTINVILNQHHFRARPWSLNMMQEMNFNKSLKIFRERFADASDFTFVIIGNFDVESMKTLLETYLASLPALNRNESWKDVGIRSPKGVVTQEVQKGIENKGAVHISMPGSFKWSVENRFNAQAVSGYLNIKLREAIREEKGGTYGISVQTSISHYPIPEYDIVIEFGCDPARANELTAIVFEQIDSLKNVGPAESYVAKLKEMYTRDYEVNIKENKFWLNNLQFCAFHKEDPEIVLTYPKLVENLTRQSLQKAAKTYLDTTNYVKVVLLPEKK